MKGLFSYGNDIFKNRELLFQLTKRDFQSRYLGSSLGMIWAFAQPFATVAVMFAAFEFGFKPGKVDGDVPFFLWLILGMIPWFFLAEALQNGANAVQDQGHIVKKIVFRVSLLPLVKIFSALLIHLFFVLVLLALACGYGYWPTWHTLQVLYYLFASFVLMLGMGMLTSSIVVFFKDLGQIIGVIVQLGMWGTPIFWSLNFVPEKIQPFVKLNPAHYIIKGYRDSFVNRVWFWQDWSLTLYFWFFTIVLLVAGVTVFKKLKPHFADFL